MNSATCISVPVVFTPILLATAFIFAEVYLLAKYAASFITSIIDENLLSTAF